MAEGEGGGVPEPPLVKCIKPDSSHLFKAGKLLTLSIITSKGKVHFDKSSFPYFLLLLFYFIFVIVIIQLPFFFPFFFFLGGGVHKFLPGVYSGRNPGGGGLEN